MALADGNISPTYMIQTAVFDIALCEIQSKFVDTIKDKINGLLVPGIRRRAKHTFHQKYGGQYSAC